MEDTFFSGNCYYHVKYSSGKLQWRNVTSFADPVCLNIENEIVAITEIKHNGDGSESTGFVVHYVLKHQHEYRYHQKPFEKTNYVPINMWIQNLTTYIQTIERRPKYIMIFLNPNSGKKKAMQIYQKKAKPYFELSGIAINLIITESAKYAENQLIQEGWSENVDGIIAFGGDGTLSEIINGVVTRTANELAADINNQDANIPSPNIRIGVIPAGSTDTTSYSIHNTSDVLTSVFHIILGNSVSVDVGIVHNDQKFLSCYISVLSYGFLGEVIASSDGLRCLGPIRYELSGFWNLIRNNQYDGKFTIICNCDEVNNKTTSIHSKNLTDCIVMQDSYFMVSGANISCASTRSRNGLAPFSQINDGCFSIIILKRISLCEKIQFFKTLASGSQIINDLPFVQVYKTRKFTFESINSQESLPATKLGLWNCDGELIKSHYISARCHQQLIKMFGTRKQTT